MNKEDYSKYYIQGSDHYLIPTEIFNELLEENQKLKADYGNIAQVERDLLLEENKELKDKWNYIKKMLKEARQEEFNIDGYCGTCTDVDIDFLLNKMRELERGKIMNIWLEYEKEKNKIKHLTRKEYEKELQKIIEKLKI